MFVYPWEEIESVISSTITIERLRFRADGGTSGGLVGNRIGAIYLSSNSTEYFTPGFSLLTGTDELLVYAGQIGEQSVSGGAPNGDVVDVTLLSPFVYHPRDERDLVIDVRLVSLDFDQTPFDAVPAAGISVTAPNQQWLSGAAGYDLPVVTLDYTTGDHAEANPYGQGCGVGKGSSIFEDFDGNQNVFDFAPDTGWRLELQDPGYRASLISDPFTFPNAPDLALSNDEERFVPLPFTLPLPNGLTTNSIWVSANGWISFYQPVGSLSPSASGRPGRMIYGNMQRVAALWEDLQPEYSGKVVAGYDIGAGEFVITWFELPVERQGGRSSFQMTLSPNGTIDVRYGSVTATGGLVGYSPGLGAIGPTSSSVDLSTFLQTPFVPGEDTNALSLTMIDRPVQGEFRTLRILEMPRTATAARLFFGTQAVQPGLPLDSIGMPSCTFSLGGVIGSWPIGIGAPFGSVNFWIPSNPALAGVRIHAQAIVASDVSESPLPIATSNGLELVLNPR